MGSQKGRCEQTQTRSISFEEVKQLFQEDNYFEFRDVLHSDFEERYIAIGPIDRGMVMAVYTERDEDIIRIISARWASKKEALLFQRYCEVR